MVQILNLDTALNKNKNNEIQTTNDFYAAVSENDNFTPMNKQSLPKINKNKEFNININEIKNNLSFEGNNNDELIDGTNMVTDPHQPKM